MNGIVPQKQCARCKQFYPATKKHFRFDQHSPDGLRDNCKGCKNSAMPKKPKFLPPYPGDVVIPEGVPSKPCTRCEKPFPLDAYYFYPENKGTSWSSHCRWCFQKDESKKPPMPVVTARKRCKACEQEFPIHWRYFRSDNRLNMYPDGHRNICNKCSDKAAREFLPPYPEHVEIPEGMPTRPCYRCGKPFPLTKQYFHAYQNQPNRLRTQCKWCSQFDKSKRPPAILRDKNRKRCPRCKHVHPATTDYFSVRTGRKGGLQSRCKQCQDEIRKARYHNLKDQMGDIWKEQRRAWVAANRGHYNAIMRVHGQKRRALKKNIPGTYTPEQVQEKLRRQHYRCYYCHKKLQRVRAHGRWEYIYHIDHTIPVTRTECNPRNDINYIVLTCPPCNESKHNKLPIEWPQGGRLF